MPQQIKLNLAEVDVGHPGPTIPPEREQQLIALMAQAIVAVCPLARELDHEPR
jgi:hypothetical protein